MKKILSLLTLSLAFGFSFCSSNNDGASNPNKTQDEYANPTGELTDSNAKAIVNAGISANTILILRTPTNIFTSELEYEECTTTSGDDTTLEWDCAFNNVIDCEGQGTTVSTDDADKEFTTVAYNDFTAECNSTTPGNDLLLQVNGDINISRDSSSIYCANIDYTNDEISRSFNGCRNSDGFILVRLDEKSFVVRSNVINDSCTQITTTIRDNNKTEEVVCDITQTDGECDGPGNIETIGNCQIQ